jgi:GYF domain 2
LSGGEAERATFPQFVKPVNEIENNQSDQWFLRVEGKEYGPVGIEDLKEWRAEGRVIPQNYLRRDGESAWVLASTLEELFPEPTQAASPPNELFRRRTFPDIFVETFRIYRKGFLQFFLLALLVAVPSFGFQLSLSFVHYPENGIASGATRIASVIAMVTLAAILVAWPIFLGGLQFGVKEIAEGRAIRIGELLRRATNYWPRIARLCAFVYGSFLFWTGLPVLFILTFAATASVISILLALLALCFQVYMFGRLFTNFLFWQQSCTLSDLDGAEALRESKELARSRKSEPALQRPIYRGAIIVSLWVLVLIAVSITVELPFTIARFQGITNFEDAYAMLQKMMSAPTPDTLMIAADVLSSLVHAALHPLLGIAFVVLYFDAKSK